MKSSQCGVVKRNNPHYFVSLPLTLAQQAVTLLHHSHISPPNELLSQESVSFYALTCDLTTPPLELLNVPASVPLHTLKQPAQHNHVLASIHRSKVCQMPRLCDITSLIGTQPRRPRQHRQSHHLRRRRQRYLGRVFRLHRTSAENAPRPRRLPAYRWVRN